MIKASNLLIALLVVYSLSACDGGSGGAQSCNVEPNLVSSSIEQHGVRLQISVDKQTYSSGELICVQSKATNISNGPVVYVQSNIGDPEVYTGIYNSDKSAVLLEDVEPYEVSPSINLVTLNPGDTAVYSGKWKTKIVHNIDAPSGDYQAWAAISVLKSPDFDEYPYDTWTVENTADLKITGTANLISEEEAFLSATSDIKAQDFFNNYDGKISCRLTYTEKYLRYLNGEWIESSIETHDELNSQGKACIFLLTPRSVWSLDAVTSYLPEPGELSVDVDISTGAIVSSHFSSNRSYEYENINWKLAGYTTPEKAYDPICQFFGGCRRAYGNGGLIFKLAPNTNRVSGTLECNSFSADYTGTPNTIKISNMVSTSASCFENNEHYLEQNNLLLSLFDAEMNIGRFQNTLVITTNEGSSLHFYPE